MRTVAARGSWNPTRASRRRGDTVASRRRSPANGRRVRTRRPRSSGPRDVAARAAEGAAIAASARTRRNSRRPTLIPGSCHALTVHSLLDAFDAFRDYVDAIAYEALGLALLCHAMKIVARTRSWRNIVGCAYPDTEVRWRTILGAYLAGVGVNAIVPARGGDVLKLFLVKRRVEGATYPTLAATLLV